MAKAYKAAVHALERNILTSNTEHLNYDRHYSKCFSSINLCNPQNNPIVQVLLLSLLLSPLYRQENCGSEKLNNLSKTTNYSTEFEARQPGSRVHLLTTKVTLLPYLVFLIPVNDTHISLDAQKSQTQESSLIQLFHSALSLLLSHQQILAIISPEHIPNPTMHLFLH